MVFSCILLSQILVLSCMNLSLCRLQRHYLLVVTGFSLKGKKTTIDLAPFDKVFSWLGMSPPLDLYNYSFIEIGQFKSSRDWYQIRNKGISGTSFTFQVKQGFFLFWLRCFKIWGMFVFLSHLTMFWYTTLSGVNHRDHVIINYTKPIYPNWKALHYYSSEIDGN